ncbi:hypothetical protein LXL04_005605 [Taraxacum kok-saghyz]
MDALLHPVNDTHGDDTLLGCIAKDTPEVQLLEKWAQLINSSNFQLSDITTGLADLLAAKEPSKLTDLKPPANLPSSTMKQFVIPKLEETNISDQELPESVPDPEPQPKSSKKKKPNKFTAQKQGPKIWTEEEEVALTHAWISISKDDFKTIRPNPRGLWDRVLEHFHTAMGMGIYRNNDAASGKWRDLKAKTIKFNDIYNNLSVKYKNEKTDFDVFNRALEKYRREKGGKPFAHLKAWEVMRNAPKWVLGTETEAETETETETETDRSKRSESKETRLQTDRPKRSRTSESNEYSVNPNDVQEIPVVQNECKRSVSSSRKDSGVELNELNNFKEKIEEFIRVQQKMMESKCDKQVLVDMQVLQLSTNGVEGEDLETMLAVKKAIREKYKKFIKPDGFLRRVIGAFRFSSTGTKASTTYQNVAPKLPSVYQNRTTASTEQTISASTSTSIDGFFSSHQLLQILINRRFLSLIQQLRQSTNSQTIFQKPNSKNDLHQSTSENHNSKSVLPQSTVYQKSEQRLTELNDFGINTTIPTRIHINRRYQIPIFLTTIPNRVFLNRSINRVFNKNAGYNKVASTNKSPMPFIKHHQQIFTNHTHTSSTYTRKKAILLSILRSGACQRFSFPIPPPPSRVDRLLIHYCHRINNCHPFCSSEHLITKPNEGYGCHEDLGSSLLR